ncbi:YjdJ family protein [Solibacillus isronensis]|uniref:YjdJ family protein n=1 Tax=Solibacillus isronensis TaxID=412383 RepID=UPI00203D17A7|nr:YjdJ family protein [Solibacillus isronensis]MCM3721530.1 YjdJ family protein [Solibacillus isronensis]
MFKYVLQIIAGILTLVVSTFIAWYEGSAIIENTLEWKYSTPFTSLFQREIINGHDISQLDYFVYAAKFQPFFPTIMIASVLYILSVTGYFLIKRKPKWEIGFCGLIGIILLLFSSLFYNSTTMGGNVFFWISSISGLLFIVITVLQYKLHNTKMLTEVK